MSLLDKALKVPVRKRRVPSDGELELAVALMQGRVNFSQAATALGYKTNGCGQTTQRLFAVIRNAAIAGLVKVELKVKP
jgi:hypothetical protein